MGLPMGSSKADIRAGITFFTATFRSMNAATDSNRITVSSIFDEAWHSITHVERGLRKTVVALAVAPGRMLQAYMAGHRKPYQKPFSFLLISTTIFALVLHLFHPYYQIPNAVSFDDRLFNNQLLLESKYYTWFHIVLLPVYALVTFLIFKRAKYNYAEWMVTCCYVISFDLVLNIPLHFLLTYLHLNSTLQNAIQLILAELYTLYALNAFLRPRMNWVRIVYILFCAAINFIIFIGALRGMSYLMTI